MTYESVIIFDLPIIETKNMIKMEKESMENTIEYENTHENKRYKDTLFRTVFNDKKYLLDLYNAVNGMSINAPVMKICRCGDFCIWQN